MKIDLLAYRQEERQLRRKAGQETVILTVIAVLLLAGASGVWWTQDRQIQVLQQQEKQLRAEVEDLANVAALAGGVSDQEMKELGSRKALLTRLEQERRLKPEQLENIYALSVPDIVIGKMEIKEAGELTISAYTDSQSQFIEFVEKLAKEEYIKEIQKISSKQNDKTGEISFTLTLAWEVAQS